MKYEILIVNFVTLFDILLKIFKIKVEIIEIYISMNQLRTNVSNSTLIELCKECEAMTEHIPGISERMTQQ
jgi:hypothetical protein